MLLLSHVTEVPIVPLGATELSKDGLVGSLLIHELVDERIQSFVSLLRYFSVNFLCAVFDLLKFAIKFTDCVHDGLDC